MFSPTESLLTTIDPLKNVDYTITYVDDLTSTSYPVTVTSSEPDPTVTVSGNRIVGYYTDPFDISINYLTKDSEYVTVTDFNSIDTEKLSQLYAYNPNETLQKTFTYTATAYDGATAVASQDYTIVVTNNWTYGRNQLLKYVNSTRYKEQITVYWTNNFGQPIPMIDNTGKEITWENNS